MTSLTISRPVASPLRAEAADLQTHALEGIGRAARFECPAPQKFCARSRHLPSAGEDLLTRFDRTGPAITMTSCRPPPLHWESEPPYRGAKTAARKLIRRGNAVRFGDPRHHLKILHVEAGRLAYTRQNCLLCTRSAMDVETDLYHPRQHMLDLFLGGTMFCIATIISVLVSSYFLFGWNPWLHRQPTPPPVHLFAKCA